MNEYGWRPYVPVAKRRQLAAKKLARLRRAGRKVAPIELEGRTIARTFWGSAWCHNLEAYSDYANRLPRGRTYVRNGSVIDLQIAGGRISALVSGTDIYQVELEIKPLVAKKWKRIRSRCAGQIDSLVELLQGQISDSVMRIVTQRREGLFPASREISLDCSCPDWATMCKHVAAVLYGVGARLDHAPEMLFKLRGVDPSEMVADAVSQTPSKRTAGRGRVLAVDDLSSVFGVDIDTGAADARAKKKPKSPRSRQRPAVKKVTRKKSSRKKAASSTRAARSVAKLKATKLKATKKKATRKKTARKKGVKKSKVGKRKLAKRRSTPSPGRRASR